MEKEQLAAFGSGKKILWCYTTGIYRCSLSMHTHKTSLMFFSWFVIWNKLWFGSPFWHFVQIGKLHAQGLNPDVLSWLLGFLIFHWDLLQWPLITKCLSYAFSCWTFCSLPMYLMRSVYVR
jgi:hypothetical protein